MQALMNEFSTVKVDALNCIDCLLGGHGKVLDIAPGHRKQLNRIEFKKQKFHLNVL